MSWLKFLRRKQWDQERAHEIDSYFEIEVAENIARGMTPIESARAARRKFGNATLIREEIYRMNTVSWLESIGQDIRYGARLLFTNPGFALVAILSLTLGIGANTAIFQLLDAIRLRNLPVAQPHELAQVKIVGGNHGLGMSDSYGELTRPMWEEIRRNHPAFSGVFAWRPGQDAVGQGSTSENVKSLYVTGDAFRTLGVQPWRGRLLAAGDEHACPNTTAAVSYAYWQTKLGGRPLNKSTQLLIDDQPVEIIGVTPPSFFGLAVGESFDIVMPFCQPKELMRNLFNASVIGRLREDWTLPKASAQLASTSPSIMAATEITGYDSTQVQNYRHFLLATYPASSGVSNLRNTYVSSLQLLLGITGLVLLIACANLANLMLARASAREREIAVRLALGAARIRLLRQLLVESALLAVTGALLGIALAMWVSHALILSLSMDMDTVTLATAIDWRVLLFTAGLTTLTTVVFGMAPSFRTSGIDPVAAMKAGGRGMTASRERFSFQRSMVVTQISISLVLLVGALLFVRSFHNLMTFNPGMREQGITVSFLGAPKSNISPEHLEEYKRQLLADMRSIPGVENAAMTTFVPLSSGSWGHIVTTSQGEGNSMFSWVSPGYFDTMGIPLFTGRPFNAGDTATSARVAVVNQTFVRRFLHGVNPLGQTLRTHPEPSYPATVYQIVGVIPDTKYNSLRDETPAMAFAPYSQFPDQKPWSAVMLRSRLSTAAIGDSVKRRMAEKHSELIVESHDFQGQIRDGLVRERLMAVLSGFFGLLAALLGMVGLYGVMSYVVTQRRNEIGIRLALGASRGQVVAMVMREVGLLLAAGIAIGTVLSLIAGRSANSLLFGLKSYDAVTLLSAAVLLAAVGALAGYLPAVRGSKLDAMTALRCD